MHVPVITVCDWVVCVCAPQNTMLRHTDNCTGEVEEDENGTPAPKKARRGRKRKMQARRDEGDTGIVNLTRLVFVCAGPPILFQNMQ